MARSFKRLERVLRLEAQQGYRNRAVVGGIRQFITFWVGQAREELSDEADRALVEQTAEVLLGYDRLPGPEKRAAVIDDLLERLSARQKRPPTDGPGRAETAPAPVKRAGAEGEPRRAAARERRRDRAAEPRDDDTRAAAAPPTGRRVERSRRAQTRQEPDDELAKARRRPPLRAEPDPEGLAQSVTGLRGVGPQIARRLANLGAETIGDLLYTFPRRYDDYTQFKPIHRLEYGEQVTLIASIWEVRARRTRNNQTMIQAIISDGSGNMTITWYNQPWLANKLSAGMQIALSGKVDQFLGRPVMTNPDWEPVTEEMLRTGRIIPVYPLTQGLSAWKMRSIMKQVAEHWALRSPDPLPPAIRQAEKLLPLPDALRQVHLPDSQPLLHQARQRLVFDELLLLQLGMLKQRQEWRTDPSRPIPADASLLDQFIASLPYELTGAQRRIIDELAGDMAREIAMTRLLQGDVGAGKTVVAAAALVLTAAAGSQAALMAPTEILAEQHYRSLSQLLEPMGFSVGLLTGSVAAGDREPLLAALADGSMPIAVGTHALIQPGVHFKDLALAVVDEQHRFGVAQRRALRLKGPDNADGRLTPHLLAMSATPIPRTLALSLYGDLDLSILDEMPPGRQEIKTHWLQARERERAYSFIQGQIDQGRQAYIIYPLVEESEKVDARAAVEEFERLQEAIFVGRRLGLVHGRMGSAEKEAVMRAFYQGEMDILVSTSVIEVGVDVPNAAVMLIEGANRFGLAQLHQFRGRVGRGEYQSYCLLIADGDSANAEERLSALEQSNDGFVLAEKDLALRGPGQFLGHRQSGLPELRLASLLDVAMLERAREAAGRLFAADPELAEYPALREQVARFWAQAGAEA